MLATAIIVFREVLEIAIIVGVVLAATSGIATRSLWVAGGMLGGLAGAGGLAFFANALTESLEGRGQEIANAVILALACMMIAWTVIWMKHHARELTSRIRKAGAAINEGHLPLYAIAVIIGLAMLREGAEIVLFMFGLIASQQTSLGEMAMGGAIGLGGGALIGVLFYCGLLTLSRKHLFTTTSLLLTFLAAGMAAQSAGYFSAAGLLPEIISPVWDSTWLLSDGAVMGKVLHALVGYSARPSGLQLVFYVVTLGVITGMLKATKDVGRKVKT